MAFLFIFFMFHYLVFQRNLFGCVRLFHVCVCVGDTTQVSWIRKRDLHILTAGILTYTSDERFKVFMIITTQKINFINIFGNVSYLKIRYFGNNINKDQTRKRKKLKYIFQIFNKFFLIFRSLKFFF